MPGILRILRLTWAPWGLLDAAVQTQTITALAAGFLGSTLTLGCLLSVMLAGTTRPHLTAEAYLLDACSTASAAFVLALVLSMLFWLVVCVLMLRRASARYTEALRLRSLALAMMTAIVPAAAWSMVAILVKPATSHGISIPAEMPGWMKSPTLGFFGAGFWLPVICAIPLLFWLNALARIEQLFNRGAARICPVCGYSRDGLPSATCPECGHTPTAAARPDTPTTKA